MFLILANNAKIDAIILFGEAKFTANVSVVLLRMTFIKKKIYVC